MELPKFGKLDGGMLDGLKSKLGFQGREDQGYDDEYYDDGYDDYGEYGDDYADYDDGYDDYADEPPARPVYRPASSGRASASSRSSASSSANLVSIDDVRAHTQIPESLNRDPLPQRHVTSAPTRSFGRNVVDSSLPYSMTPEGSAAISAAGNNASARRSRSEGLDSLFEPSTPAANSTASAMPSAARSSAIASAVPAVSSTAGASAGASTYDPYEAYSGTGSQTSYRSVRSVTVLKPMNYGEVERVAKALKAGDAVVLALANTPQDLSKRVLDFSFGVSAALDANVECVANKVFSITRGNALTEAERMNLRSQGVL